jgi:type IV pilus biogenesis protein CpaD/CtpE
MLNIVEKYSADTAVESEDGVVAIEYVSSPAARRCALCSVWWSALATTLATKHLDEIVNGI